MRKPDWRERSGELLHKGRRADRGVLKSDFVVSLNSIEARC